jgi:hypothetical protein
MADDPLVESVWGIPEAAYFGFFAEGFGVGAAPDEGVERLTPNTKPLLKSGSSAGSGGERGPIPIGGPVVDRPVFAFGSDSFVIIFPRIFANPCIEGVQVPNEERRRQAKPPDRLSATSAGWTFAGPARYRSFPGRSSDQGLS